MITRDQWDKLTPQQQWDQYCLLVSECGDSDEVDDSDEETEVKKPEEQGGLMSKKEKVFPSLFKLSGITNSFPYKEVDLGVFSSRKKARKALKSIVGHNLTWHIPLNAPDLEETRDVIGFVAIHVGTCYVDTDFAARRYVGQAMEEAMLAEESNPVDDFLKGLTSS